MYAKCLLVCGIALSLSLLPGASFAQNLVREPHGPHCIGHGPVTLPVDYCGCTWGGVYYRGQPIANAPVTLHFNQQMTTTVSQFVQAEPYPIYELRGQPLGAKLNDVITVTTTLAGFPVTRTFRAQPDTLGDQQIPLIIPAEGRWSTWLDGGYTNSLVVHNNTLWTGGSAGLRAVDVTTNVSQTHALPWPTQTVVALAVAPDGAIWAAGSHHLAHFDGATWQNVTAPFMAAMHTLLVDSTGAVWVGGGDNSGALAVLTQSWITISGITAPVRSLQLDKHGELWVGTAGAGVYRHTAAASDPNHGWQQYTAADGLASDYINTIAMDANHIWFGTAPHIGEQGPLGGVGRYTPQDNTWRRYSAMHGLPANRAGDGAADDIYALAVSEDGQLWAGTNAGIYRLLITERWLNETPQATTPVMSLATQGALTMIGRTDRLEKLDRSLPAGHPPLAIIETTLLTHSVAATLTFRATASDPDTLSDLFLGWEWTSDRVGPLCTTADQCEAPAYLLGVGRHQIQLRVQDEEGMWSAPVQVTVTVVPASSSHTIYLPLVQR